MWPSYSQVVWGRLLVRYGELGRPETPHAERRPRLNPWIPPLSSTQPVVACFTLQQRIQDTARAMPLLAAAASGTDAEVAHAVQVIVQRRQDKRQRIDVFQSERGRAAASQSLVGTTGVQASLGPTSGRGVKRNSRTQDSLFASRNPPQDTAVRTRQRARGSVGSRPALSKICARTRVCRTGVLQSTNEGQASVSGPTKRTHCSPLQQFTALIFSTFRRQTRTRSLRLHV